MKVHIFARYSVYSYPLDIDYRIFISILILIGWKFTNEFLVLSNFLLEGIICCDLLNPSNQSRWSLGRYHSINYSQIHTSLAAVSYLTQSNSYTYLYFNIGIRLLLENAVCLHSCYPCLLSFIVYSETQLTLVSYLKIDNFIG